MVMEQFEKYWDKNKHDFKSRIIYVSRWHAASQVWKAALQWVQNVDGGHAECDVLGDCLMQIKIDKELGDDD